MSKEKLKQCINDYIWFHKKYTYTLFNCIKSNTEFINDYDIKVLLQSYKPAYRFFEYSINLINSNEDLNIIYEDNSKLMNKLLSDYNSLKNEYNSLNEKYELAQNNINILQGRYENICEEKDYNKNYSENIESIEEISKIVESNISLTPSSDSSNRKSDWEYFTDAPCQYD